MTRAEYEEKYGVPAPDVPAGTAIKAPRPVSQSEGGNLGSIAGNVLKAVVTDPINALVVTPADRLAEAVGRTGVLGGAIKQGYEQMADAGESRSYLGMKVDAQKAFGKGATGQIAGQGLKSASYLAGGALAVPFKGAAATTALGGAAKGALQGAIAAGATGALGGAGETLYKGGTLDQAGKKAIEGGLMGAATGGVLGGVIGGITGGLNGAAMRKKELLEALKSGNTANENIAKIKLQGDRIVNDPLGSKAVQTGVPKTDVAVIKTMSQADRADAKTMLKLAQEAVKDKTILDRPADIVGKTLLEPLREIQRVNKEFASQLDDVALSLKGQKVNPGAAITEYADDLTRQGVSIADDGSMVFQGTQYRTNPKAQKLLEQAYKEVANTADDGLALHRTKKALDELINHEKTSEGVLGTAEGMVKQLRKQVDAVLDTTFDSYNNVNTGFSSTKKALEAADDIMGTKFSLDEGVTADIKAGSVMRRILGNNAGRGDILKTVSFIEDTAKKFNIPVEKSAVRQMIFADTLEDIFGTQATTGLQGQVERGVASAIVKKGTNIIRNPLGTAADIADDVFKNVSGATPEGKIKAIQALLDATDDTIAPSTARAFGTAAIDKIKPLTKPITPIAKEAYGLGAPQVASDVVNPSDALAEANRQVVDQIDNQNLFAKGVMSVPYADMDGPMRAQFLKNVVDAHINTAKQIVQNTPASDLAQAGGMPAIIQSAKNEIITGLAADKATDLAQALAKIDTSGVKTLEQLAALYSSLLK